MRSKRAIEIIADLASKYESPDIAECASSMCVIDINAFGIDDWLMLDANQVVEIFRETAEETLGELMDEALSKSAVDDLLEDVLDSSAHKIDFKQALIGMKEGCIKYFKALELYLVLHEEVKWRALD